jgi:hypothetical protein
LQFINDGLQVISDSRDGTVSYLHPFRLLATCTPTVKIYVQVRLWDAASGEEIRRVSKDEFSFCEGPPAQQQTDHYVLTADGDMLLIKECAPNLGDACPLVACFRAPQRISALRCFGTTVCLGCSEGAILFLRVPFLTGIAALKRRAAID